MPTDTVTELSSETPVVTPNKQTKKWAIIAILVIVFVAVVGLAGYLIGDYIAKNSSKSSTSSVSSSSSTSSVSSSIAADQITSDATYVYFNSEDLGIKFQLMGDQNLTPLRKGNYVIVGGQTIDDGSQYVEVFSKKTTETVAEAVQRMFLTGYAATDCWATVSSNNNSLPNTYQRVVISYPEYTGDGPAYTNADKCPATYTPSGGIAYFVGSSEAPDKLLFFKIGQYAIMGTDTNDWASTVRFL